MRLRQVVFAVRELEPAVRRLREALALGEPYADPGVALFGLRNAVMALGADFVEVVSPAQEGTAAGRHLDRRGDGGYMVIVQVDDIAGARTRAADLGIRTAWEIDLEDIAATHLHPADAGGTLLSIDQATPPGAWRWGGPDWTGRAGPPTGGRLLAVTVESPQPDATAERWSRVVGGRRDGRTVTLPSGQRIVFAAGQRGLVEVTVDPGPGREAAGGVAIGAARIRFAGAGAPG